MTDVEKVKRIVNGLELIDIHKQPNDIDCYYTPEFNFEDYHSEFEDKKNLEEIICQPLVHIYANPSNFTPKEIVSYFTEIHEASVTDDSLDMNYGGGDVFGLSNDKKYVSYNLVAFSDDDLNKPIGFSRFSVHIESYDDHGIEDKKICLFMNYSLDYVCPDFRGLGYGFGLAMKRAEICIDHISSVLELLQDTSISLQPYSLADWESTGGEKLTDITNDEIEGHIDYLIQVAENESRQININKLMFDGGH